MERMDEVLECSVINNKQVNELKQIYNFIMQKRLKSQAEALLNNKKPDNKIASDQFSVIDKNTFKKAVHEIGILQLKLRQDF